MASTLCFLTESTPVGMKLCHVGYSYAIASQELIMIEMSFSEAFRVCLKCFFPATYRMEKFSIQKSFWHAVVWHPFDVTCPSALCLACLSVNAECTCSAQDCCVWYSVLPSILSTLHRLERWKSLSHLSLSCLL